MWMISFMPRLLFPCEKYPVSIGWEAGWASETVWILWSSEKSLAHQESNLGCPTCSLSLYRPSYLCFSYPYCWYKIRKWGCTLCHDIHTKFHEKLFKLLGGRRQWTSWCLIKQCKQTKNTLSLPERMLQKRHHKFYCQCTSHWRNSRPCNCTLLV
jgi:hypothetical protein